MPALFPAGTLKKALQEQISVVFLFLFEVDGPKLRVLVVIYEIVLLIEGTVEVAVRVKELFLHLTRESVLPQVVFVTASVPEVPYLLAAPGNLTKLMEQPPPPDLCDAAHMKSVHNFQDGKT